MPRIELTNASIAGVRTEMLDGDEDSFEFTAETEDQKGLLLPAVQVAPEGRSRTSDEASDDSFDFKAASEGVATSDAAVLDFALTGDGDFLMGDGHGGWIDILSMDKGTHKPHSEEETRPAGLQSDGELVQAAIIDAGDFAL